VWELNAERARQGVLEHTQRLAEAAVAAGPAANVPTAPGWATTDLVTHVGQTQHWVAEIIERRITDPRQLPTEFAEPPTDFEQWPTWLSTSAQRLTRACSDDTLDAVVFNAAGDERPGTRFWLVSVLNEAVIHGFDAANTAGRPVEIDADIAGALISNHLAMLTSPTWQMLRPESAQALRGTGQTLQWAASDIGDDIDAWVIERQPDAPTWHRRTRQAHADATVAGPVGSLLLVLTRRLLLDDPSAHTKIDGDSGLVRHWLDHTAHVSG
jgi:uncharacterized protein (TIGR03083 family)